ncbi:putative ABC transport system permease protein [Arsukibacterium tuosuense]|uniref:Putative ABC transport system permease protein n=1 Tax=Arsukibacterium tuosuense TaxID=1323745 RepID=A0A285J6L9_9GAMM|nr:ABC transporter permease [Arsukibacterium tuosuense]SNY55868.1 putative ABC transport system permease protein [Arsukibacterium tuosuense]
MQLRQPSLWVLHALLSHWWRHPVQLSTLILGLLAATALWSGVQALNQQARFSYEQAAARFNSINQAHIVSTTEQHLAEADYIQLRGLGWKVSPLVEGALALATDDLTLNVIGIEPLTLQSANASYQGASGLPANLSLNHFLTPPWEVWVSPLTAERITPLLKNTTKAGFPINPEGDQVSIKVSSALANNELITDIYLAQHWLNMEGQLSRLLLFDHTQHSQLSAELATRMRLILPQSDHDISRLTASFHLNLTALSLLAFLVGLLMVYSAIHLALTQRLTLRRILFSCGVSQRELMAWLLVELLLLSGLIALPGLVLGYWIAALLLPDLSASLTGLYGAQISGDLQLSWQWWLQGVFMAWGGTLIAAIVPLLKLIKHDGGHPSQSMSFPGQQKQRNTLMAAGLFTASLALLMAWLGDSLLSGFLLLALVFLSAALLMPVILDSLLRLCQRFAHSFSADSVTPTSATAQWLWADARMQVPHLSVALIALLLALSTSIGVGGMVEGFRNTFTGWLDQRLAAEVYVRTDSETQAQEVTQWLSQQANVTAILPSAGKDVQLADMPIELRGIQIHSTYIDHWPLLSKTSQAWHDVESGAAVMINEQLARQLMLNIGDNITIPGMQQTEFTIGAIFSDYGNPKGQVMMALDTLYLNWADAKRGSFALRVEPAEIDVLIQALTERFSFTETQVIDQQAVKRYSLQLFERTFAATQALNLLVLAIAAIALFSSLLTLSTMRLSQIAPIWACGISRRQLVITELFRLLLLALMTALLAIPLGLIISYCLVTVINVRAFGWALPWQVFPLQWLYLTLAALFSAFLAAIVPVLKLRFSSPGELLKGFRDDQ